MDIPDRIEREVVIEAPLERVWALITEAEHVGSWFGDAGAEIDLRPGGEMTMSWEKHGTVHARVERVEAQRVFAYRWAPFQDPGGAEPVEGNSTLVEFTLTEQGGATRLRVVESGFSSLDASNEQRLELHDGNVEGWQAELGDLAEYAARVAA
jgi:uncharacterized protein YndB with AHSA1/START domain